MKRHDGVYLINLGILLGASFLMGIGLLQAMTLVIIFSISQIAYAEAFASEKK